MIPCNGDEEENEDQEYNTKANINDKQFSYPTIGKARQTIQKIHLK